MASYGELLNTHDPHYDMATKKLYSEMVQYFENPVLYKVKNVDGMSQYMCKTYCLLSNYCRYMIVLVPENEVEIGTKIDLNSLEWKVFQTRTLTDKHTLPVHSYEVRDKGFLKSEITRKSVQKGVTVYDCDEYPIQIGLIHQKNDVQSEYNKNGTILSAIESYQCVINFI